MPLLAKNQKTNPLLKYPGGKEKELKYIIPALPLDAQNYYEPFVGSGAVYLTLMANQYFINDKSTELMGLYKMADEQDSDFFGSLKAMSTCWDYLGELSGRYHPELLSLYNYAKNSENGCSLMAFPLSLFLNMLEHSLPDMLSCRQVPEIRYLLAPEFWSCAEKSFRNKIPRMITLEKTRGDMPEEDIYANLEGCFKNAFYLYMRDLYNHREELPDGEQIALYYFLREYCYASMFRYNKSGEFNVPYGGISYNAKSLEKKIETLQSADFRRQLKRTVYTALDFEEFIDRFVPNSMDFMFLDPPYDTEFASYDGNPFGRDDQQRLASYLLEKCPCYFMLVIKNTDYIRELYPEGAVTASGRPIYIYKFDKKYFVSFKSRNDRHAEHLMITNYPVPVDMDFLEVDSGFYQ